MCIYCEETFKGDTNEYFTDMPVEMNGVEIGYITSWIDYDETGGSEATLRTMFDTPGGDYICGDSIWINYCPVCGRKLKEETE